MPRILSVFLMIAVKTNVTFLKTTKDKYNYFNTLRKPHSSVQPSRVFNTLYQHLQYDLKLRKVQQNYIPQQLSYLRFKIKLRSQLPLPSAIKAASLGHQQLNRERRAYRPSARKEP